MSQNGLGQEKLRHFRTKSVEGGGIGRLGGFGRGRARAGGRGGNRGPIPLFPDAAMQAHKIKCQICF